ncbi:RNA polymerase ECF-type sigma factor [Indibacter alkaliphilus LW1]|uniref:RNA polymerase ECF-type sigma factor n=1 Tax=Indibacter alkaliphilus (strain CCUG 57479 / KCTC 22604 / LW1) TaxID=1189612 RepID=S2E3V0_INDAL|nr:sigma-70 family RNA polymerase sigma factor [Indibacter alkaliphilus]EOZ99216.1 RNA polymerase ECF-type sigma factor [Indibacter alkaliphilus LW1]
MEKKDRFFQIVKQNEGLIFKVAMLYTYNPQDREDLYQEIVFQLWKSFDSFSEKSKLSTWMYRVAMNTAIYNLKSTKKQVNTVPLELVTMGHADVSDKLEEERLKLLYEHIQLLNLLEKGIILLFLEGKSHQEIAEIIGITTSNVGTKISRIKEKLKSTITKAN